MTEFLLLTSLGEIVSSLIIAVWQTVLFVLALATFLKSRIVRTFDDDTTEWWHREVARFELTTILCFC